MMPSTRLVPFRCHFEPKIFERMERQRKSLRLKTSRNRFVEEAVLDKLEELEQESPTHEPPRRKPAA